MSASLVGSEMCIRDRPLPACAASSRSLSLEAVGHLPARQDVDHERLARAVGLGKGVHACC
eukprot:1124296-Alexandrium_andersonii.AAC.1